MVVHPESTPGGGGENGRSEDFYLPSATDSAYVGLNGSGVLAKLFKGWCVLSSV